MFLTLYTVAFGLCSPWLHKCDSNNHATTLRIGLSDVLVLKLRILCGDLIEASGKAEGSDA